ncbi:MAG: FAD-dependent oxidoreductase [Saccharofermentanales bacterium]|nr:FAD-binding protein [Clostridiaceae bacterium]
MQIIKTEVAVIGSGLAGLSAALVLAENGIKVMVFEKRPFQGGAVSNTPMCTMVVRNERKFQDRAFEVHNEFTNYNGNMGLARTWINNSWRIPGLITGLGLDFAGKVETSYDEIGTINAYTGGFPKGMNLGDYYLLKARGKGHGGALICLRAVNKIRALGGEIHFNRTLTEILVDQGRIIGAIVTDKAGGKTRIDCQALIVATGGFSENREMVKKYTGFDYTDANCSNGGNVMFNHFVNAQTTGEAHQAVWAAGGAKGPVSAFGRLVPGPGIVSYTPWFTRNNLYTVAEQPYLLINRNGKRFINEAVAQTSMNQGVAIKNQPGRYAFLLFDEETLEHLEQVGTEYAYMIFPAKKITNLREQFREVIEDQGNQHVFVADSLDDFSRIAGIDREGLLETVIRYNQLCDDGYDQDFGKNPKYLYPVRKSRFYGLRIVNSAYNTLGGIRTNEKCEVINDEQKPIKGLYSAGDCMAGELYGDPSLAVCSLSTVAFTLGMVCADQATAYVREGI